ncbi:MAG: DUF1328 domain-containing protein [Halobacteriota archaeon]|uniref:DUF1328 domain-containing protein n=1 Tax=Natronomonas sp. TaxID=2184060 RepID=UPI0039760792
MTTHGSILAGNSALLPAVPLQGSFIELAILFVILAIVAAVLGARGVAGLSMTIAKWFIILFIVLAIISLVL